MATLFQATVNEMAGWMFTDYIPVDDITDSFRFKIHCLHPLSTKYFKKYLITHPMKQSLIKRHS